MPCEIHSSQSNMVGRRRSESNSTVRPPVEISDTNSSQSPSVSERFPSHSTSIASTSSAIRLLMSHAGQAWTHNQLLYSNIPASPPVSHHSAPYIPINQASQAQAQVHPAGYRMPLFRPLPETIQGDAYVLWGTSPPAPTPILHPPQVPQNLFNGWIQAPMFDPAETIADLIHYIQNRIFVCVKSNCDCRNTSVTRMSYSPQLIGREVRWRDRPRPRVFKPVEVVIKGAPHYECLNYETKRSGGATVNPGEYVENFDVYHGPVDHLLLEDLTDHKARILVRFLKECNRTNSFASMSCYIISKNASGGISVPLYEGIRDDWLNTYPAFLIQNAIDSAPPPYTPPPYSPAPPYVPAPPTI